MARRVYADLDSEVLQRLGNRTDITATQRGFFIQDAYLRIAAAYDHVELQGESSAISTTSPLDYVSTAAITDLWWPILVKDSTNGFVLSPEDKSTIDNMLKASSQPRKFYWYAQRFVFDCNAAGTYTIYTKYKKKPIEIAGGASSVLDQIYDMLIILKAAEIGFETSRDWESATMMITLYKRHEIDLGLIPTKQERLNDYRQGIRVRVQ